MRGSNPDRGKGCFSSPKRSDRLWGPPCFLSHGYWDYLLGLKRPGRDADLSRHLMSGLRMNGAERLLPPFHRCAFMTCTWHLPLPLPCGACLSPAGDKNFFEVADRFLGNLCVPGCDRNGDTRKLVKWMR